MVEHGGMIIEYEKNDLPCGGDNFTGAGTDRSGTAGDSADSVSGRRAVPAHEGFRTVPREDSFFEAVPETYPVEN